MSSYCELAKPVAPLALKLLAGRAFRPPTVVELFAANTWTAATAADDVRAETQDSLEAAADWRVSRGISVREAYDLWRARDGAGVVQLAAPLQRL